MHEDTELAGVQGTAGISRRDMLRKSAVVGGAGALMWAAPSITKFGGAAFGAEGTPPTGFSYGAAIVDYDPRPGAGDPGHDGYRIKFEQDDGEWDDAPGTAGGTGNALPACETTIDATAWNAASPRDGGDFGIVIGGEDDVSLTFTLPATSPDGNSYRFRNGDSSVYTAVKDAQDCENGDVSADGKTVTFDLTPFT